MKHTLVLISSLFALAGCSADPVSPENKAPVVSTVTVGLDTVYLGDACPVTCVASDPDGNRLTYQWIAGSGRVSGSGRDVVYTPTSCCLGGNLVVVVVRDGRGGETRAELFIPVRQ
jgi:hypothetical protein